MAAKVGVLYDIKDARTEWVKWIFIFPLNRAVTKLAVSNLCSLCTARPFICHSNLTIKKV